MQRIETLLTGAVIKGALELWQAKIETGQVQLQKTRREFTGDLTLVVFPLVRLARKSPEQTAEELGDFMKKDLKEVRDYNVIK